jgi:hypothetical protein
MVVADRSQCVMGPALIHLSNKCCARFATATLSTQSRSTYRDDQSPTADQGCTDDFASVLGALAPVRFYSVCPWRVQEVDTEVVESAYG